MFDRLDASAVSAARRLTRRGGERTRIASLTGVFALALILTSCGSPRVAPERRGAGAQLGSTASRALVIAIRTEPGTLAQKVLASGVGTSFATTQRAFNATLGLFDTQGMARPYLAEALPELNSATWQVYPDGRMETTHRLRPDLSWQDGQALTADDFAFAWRVYSSAQVGIAGVSPQNLMAEVVAADPRTVAISWKRPYKDAAVLAEDAFPALPKHILLDSFEQDPAALSTHPFFAREYVGLGPYRLSRWEPGAFIEGMAFDGHSLGKPRIGQIRIVFIGDTSAALASLLAEEVHFSTDSSIRFQQGLVLQRRWGPMVGGTVIWRPESFRAAWVQMRPPFVNPQALLDVRVRRALAHSIQRKDLNDALFEGQGVMAESPFITPTATYYRQVDAAIAKYPFDLRATEQLMTDAGLRKGPDAVFASAAAGRVRVEIKTLAATEREKEMAVLGNGWRLAGFEVGETVLPASQAADNQARATFPSLFTYSTSEGEYALAAINSSNIGSPESRWIGTNRGGWSSEEFDRLAAAFTEAVDPADRARSIAEMARVFTEELPAIPLLFDLRAYAYVAGLHGPQSGPPQTLIAWNIHEWFWQ